MFESDFIFKKLDSKTVTLNYCTVQDESLSFKEHFVNLHRNILRFHFWNPFKMISIMMKRGVKINFFFF